MSNTSLLRSERVREGFAKKAASAKGKDECRGNWQERYFVLIKHELHYYKKKDDSTPKGSIDLRAAKVDAALESVTGKPFCIRIAQAKQTFVYIQYNSEEDREKWVQCLRVGAGYKEGISLVPESSKDIHNDLPAWVDRSETLVTFPLLLLPTPDSEHPERITLSLTDAHGGAIRLVKGDALYSSYRASQINRVDFSAKPELRLVDTAGVHELHTCTILIKLTPTATSLIKYVFFAGSIDDARLLTFELRAMARGEFSTIKKIANVPVLQSGYLEFGDTAVASGWIRRFCCLTDRRIILYKTAASLVPTWVVQYTNAIYREGKVGIRIGTSLETVILKFESEPLRDLWLQNLLAAGHEVGNKLLIELKEAEDFEKEEALKKADAERKQKIAEETAKMKIDQEKIQQKIAASEEKAAAVAPTDVKILVQKIEDFGAGEPAFIAALGLGEQGQLGNRGLASSLVPQLVDSLVGKNVRNVAAGKEHSACVTESGHVFLWGSGKQFQLGLGERMLESRAPCLNTSLLRFGGMAMVACGVDHTIAVSFTGQVFTWGNGATGALGHGRELKNMPYPQLVEAFKKRPICFASAGAAHSAFITADSNELYLCGTNASGCLGLNNFPVGVSVGDPQPCAALNQVGKVTAVSCSNNFTTAIVAPGRLFAWGANANGQLGVRDKVDKATPTLVQFPGKTQPIVKQVATGSSHCIALVALDDANLIYTWGAPICNGFRELQMLPTLIAALSATPGATTAPPVYVQAGHSSSHSVCVNSANQMFSFGLNEYGELGNGTAGVQALVKVRLNPACRINKAVCGAGFTLTLCKGAAPDQLSSKPAQAAPAVPEKSGLPIDLTPANPETGPSLDEAAVQIAKLLQLQADREAQTGTKVRVEPGYIEIDAHRTAEALGKMNIQTQPQSQPQQSQSSPSLTSDSSHSHGASPVDSSHASPTGTIKLPLPAGWKKVRDERSGRNYYYHTVTKETTWTRPTE